LFLHRLRCWFALGAPSPPSFSSFTIPPIPVGSRVCVRWTFASVLVRDVAPWKSPWVYLPSKFTDEAPWHGSKKRALPRELLAFYDL
jgi:hypothetical protein